MSRQGELYFCAPAPQPIAFDDINLGVGFDAHDVGMGEWAAGGSGPCAFLMSDRISKAFQIPSLRSEWEHLRHGFREDFERRLTSQDAFVQRLLDEQCVERRPSKGDGAERRPSKGDAAERRGAGGLFRRQTSSGTDSSLPGFGTQPLAKRTFALPTPPPTTQPCPAEKPCPAEEPLRSTGTAAPEGARDAASSPSRCKMQKRRFSCLSFDTGDPAAATDDMAAPKTSVRHSRRYIRQNTSVKGIMHEMQGMSPRTAMLLDALFDKGEAVWNMQEPKRTGCLAAFLKSSKANVLLGAVILANTFWTFYMSDWSIAHLAEPMMFWQRVVETIFCVIWVIELSVKLFVHRGYFVWNQDWQWNILDAVLVVLALMDLLSIWLASVQGANLSFLRSLRVLRLGRVVRIFRIFRLFRELRNILNSIFGSLISLFWCLLMLSVILTAFALVFVILIKDHMVVLTADGRQEELDELSARFGSVGNAMLSLYAATTGGDDWIGIYRVLVPTGSLTGLLFLTFISFFNFAVFNVLTGIFVDNAMKVSKMDQEKLILEQRRKDVVEGQLLTRLCESMDDDESGTITWEEFEKHLRDYKVAAHFASLGVEVHDASTFFEMLENISGKPEVDIDIFVKGCMRMKGFATSIDMQTLAWELRCVRKEQEQLVRTVLALVSAEHADQASSRPTTPRADVVALLASSGRPGQGLLFGRPRE